jgi:RNA polymerase subunit RPABC4/transcription elongation factor Spt4
MSPVFPQRDRVIPVAGWITAGCLFAVVFLVLNLTIHDVSPPIYILLRYIVPAAAAAYAVLVAYIYGDSRRRGMRYVMWTLLAIFLSNGIGVILYFILREPLPEYCSACGSMMHRGYAFCPRCGSNVLPACGSCRRVSQPGWSHCAYCGTRL